MQRFCRVCLHAAAADMTCIYSGTNDKQLASMLSSFTRLQMFLGDRMPTKVCLSCRELIIQCYTFKVKCERSDAAMRAFLRGDIVYNVTTDPIDTNVKLEDESVDQLILDDHDILERNSIGGGGDIDYKEIKMEIDIEPNSDIFKSDTQRSIAKYKGNIDSVGQDLNSARVEQVTKCSKQVLICTVCNKHYKDKERFSKHMKNHSVTGEEQCEICGKNCKSGRGLLRHILSAHKSDSENARPFRCKQCKWSFLTEKDLKIHSAVHSGELKCHECQKHFITMLQLKRHIKRHMDEKPYKCQHCNKTFSELSALHRHQRRHFGTVVEKKHFCSYCGKNFAEKSVLKVHERGHTGERPYECVECERSFISVRLLNSHKRTHDENKPYKCKLCDKSFRHTATLATHRRTHTGERPYVCSVCGKTFIQSSNLTLHMRVHSGERPYGCKLCNNRFTSWSTMKAHERTHTGEKPYSCKICGQRFARMDMKVHMRRHTGERPYACTLCNKSFYTSIRLHDHSQLHSGIKPYECKFCGLKLGAKSSLLKHVKKHHIGNADNIDRTHGLKLSSLSSKNNVLGNEPPSLCTVQICDYIAGTENGIDQNVVKEEDQKVVSDEVSVVIADLASTVGTEISHIKVIPEVTAPPCESETILNTEFEHSCHYEQAQN